MYGKMRASKNTARANQAQRIAACLRIHQIALNASYTEGLALACERDCLDPEQWIDRAIRMYPGYAPEVAIEIEIIKILHGHTLSNDASARDSRQPH